jgi:hypothetical protein
MTAMLGSSRRCRAWYCDYGSTVGARLLGLAGGDTAWLNDDRVGRALVTLFDADRASLLTDLIVGVIAEFGVDTSEMHNDSTSVSVHGDYRDADGRLRRGKPTAAVTFGHSKDHRPDLLTVRKVLSQLSGHARTLGIPSVLMIEKDEALRDLRCLVVPLAGVADCHWRSVGAVWGAAKFRGHSPHQPTHEQTLAVQLAWAEAAA